MAVDEQRANRIERVPPIVAQPNDEIEATLADPDLRLFFTNQADSDGSNDVPRRQPHPRGRLAIDRDLQLREARELLRPQVGNAVNAANQPFRLLRKSSQLVEIRPEDPDREIRRRPAQALVDAHAQAAS